MLYILELINVSVSIFPAAADVFTATADVMYLLPAMYCHVTATCYGLSIRYVIVW